MLTQERWIETRLRRPFESGDFYGETTMQGTYPRQKYTPVEPPAFIFPTGAKFTTHFQKETTHSHSFDKLSGCNSKGFSPTISYAPKPK